MLRWLNKKSESITSAAAVVALFSVLSRVVGFVRDRILAGAFGASDVLDVYFAAFRVPDLFFQLVVVGALSASFIPVFTKYFDGRRKKQAWKFTNQMLNLLGLAFGVMAVAGIIFALPLSVLIAPGFAPDKQLLLAQMSRVMFLAQILLSGSMVFGSVLQGAKRFFLFSLAPIFYNFGIIFGALVFVIPFGPVGLAWGVVLGAFLHFLVQWIGARALGFRYRFILQWNTKDIRYVLRHTTPRVLGLAANQVNFLLMTIIASTLVAGSVTVLQFAYNLNFFAVGVVGVSYAVAAFPAMCALANKKKTEELLATVSKTIRQMLLFLVPATVLFILLRAQVVRLVVGAGEFDWAATILTANTLAFFVISLTLQGIVFLLVRVFFAQGNTTIPFAYGLVAALVNLLFAILLVPRMGVAGLGLSYSIAVTVQCLLLWMTIRIRTGSLEEGRVAQSLMVFALASVVSGPAVQGMKDFATTLLSLDTFWGVLLQLVLAGGTGLGAYLAMVYLFRNEELLDFIHGIQRKFLSRAAVEEVIESL